ncbi:unnamed protein product [Ilex paraguariensis]|uniref:Uncharacterized protein n=1 Tax=Ilex paraguariensis TaxID=185542 RepID=A0ABC8TI95_9AQUA
MFGVSSNAVNRTVDGFVISINCSCPPGHDDFTWHMEYTVQHGDSWESISAKFGSFVVEKPDKTLIGSTNITLDLLCGCSESVELLTYRIKTGDTLYTICSRFSSDVGRTTKLNKLDDPALIHAGDVIFIPEPGGLKNLSLIGNQDPIPKAKKLSKSQFPVIVGSILAAAIVVLLLVIIFWFYYKRKGTKAFRRGMKYLPCDFYSSRTSSKSQESIVSSINSGRATVFPYNEVCDATSNFSASLKIGQGSYGLVYHGKLRGMDVAIKQMKNTKSKEFLSELNILCRVHHTNLIELIGYAAGGESLFLVYELAQNGALSDHLHNSTVRGFKPLSWTTRVQISLDAAKGLEYIHVHTKPYYVHRDVKTSNILLDSSFRAKVEGLASLVKLLSIVFY